MAIGDIYRLYTIMQARYDRRSVIVRLSKCRTLERRVEQVITVRDISAEPVMISNYCMLHYCVEDSSILARHDGHKISL